MTVGGIESKWLDGQPQTTVSRATIEYEVGLRELTSENRLFFEDLLGDEFFEA